MRVLKIKSILFVSFQSLFKNLVPNFRKPLVTLKVVPKAACDSETVPKNGYDMYGKSTSDNKGKQQQKS